MVFGPSLFFLAWPLSRSLDPAASRRYPVNAMHQKHFLLSLLGLFGISLSAGAATHVEAHTPTHTELPATHATLACSDGEGVLDYHRSELEYLRMYVEGRKNERAIALADLLLLNGTFEVTLQFHDGMNTDQRRDATRAIQEAAAIWQKSLEEIGSAELGPKLVLKAEAKDTRDSSQTVVPALRGKLLIRFERDPKLEGVEGETAGYIQHDGWHLQMTVRTHSRNPLGGTMRLWRKTFVAIMLHEIGHPLGLDHFPNGRNIMGRVTYGYENLAPSPQELSTLKTLRDEIIRLRAQAIADLDGR